MTNLPPNLSPAEVAAWNDYRSNLWQAFQNNYEDRWDQAKWQAAVASYQTRHHPATLSSLRAQKLMPSWTVIEGQLKRGPPPFLRPGWVSPLQGKQVDLDWLDQDDGFVHVRGSKDNWRDATVLIIEFWASYVNFVFFVCSFRGYSLPCHNVFPHLTEIAATQLNTKIISFANEGIFNGADTDVSALEAFIYARNDMEYPIYVDSQRVAFNALFKPGQNASIPLVFIITVQDRTIRWIGNAEEMAKPLADVLASVEPNAKK
ncbi:hypothetical protein BC835DRAFT_1297788 [Cytidiella melzeri]|nr:hypothetical protein BC835DRAFT_1297788 [Cytidiella melzeri]